MSYPPDQPPARPGPYPGPYQQPQNGGYPPQSQPPYGSGQQHPVYPPPGYQQPQYQQPQYQQPPWPQSGYQQAWPPPGQQPPSGPNRPPQRPWFRRHPVWSGALAVLALLFVAGAIGDAIQGPPKQTAADSAVSSATTSLAASAQPTPRISGSTTPAADSKTSLKATVKSKPKGSSINAEADACDNRQNASGDIYVWMLVPGIQAEAQELGGEWRWDYATNKCLTSVQLTLAAAPTNPGTCTQVGYVADNPGYDPNATPAKRLNVLAGEVGPAC
jgi:hypothetical protein